MLYMKAILYYINSNTQNTPLFTYCPWSGGVDSVK